MICYDCESMEGTLLKELEEEPNKEKSYSYADLMKMTEVCASCGSENIKIN